jgi:aryl-alcohol dehydrogenase-like predicted oxidoreductase
MSRLAIGTVQFGLSYGIANQGGQVSRQDAKSILRFASANGIKSLDTAIAYGESEACLGEVGTKGFELVTKLPPIPNDCHDVKGWVHEQVRSSLSRLRVTNIYGLLLHQPSQLLGKNGPELFQALQEVKDNDLVHKIGISIYSPCELDLLMPKYEFELVQAPFNLVDQRLFSSGWMSKLKDHDIEIHTRSVFLQGLLLMNKFNIPNKFSDWNELWMKWHQWLSENKVSAVQACLAFSLSFPEIDRVIVGVDSKIQLIQLMASEKEPYNSNFPDIRNNDQNLIDPVNWSIL